MSPSVRAGRRSVPISHADRVLWPDDGITKLDLARYYAGVAGVMVPHVRGRPLALHSFPQGIAAPGFFIKDAPRHFPGWIATSAVPKREGGTIHHVLANDAATLVYLAGQTSSPPTRGPAAPTASSGPTA
jgi:bifunctional non-homologous end joining protein LigD